MRRIFFISFVAALLLAATVGAQEEPTPTPDPTGLPEPTELPEPSPPPPPTPSPSPTPVESPLPSPSPSPVVSVQPEVVKPDAVKMYNNKNYLEAISICLDEIKVTPWKRDPYIVAGWSYIALGRFQEAFDISQQGIERTGADARLAANAEEALVKAYENLYNTGKFNEALVKIQTLLSFSPDSGKLPTAYAAMGEIYLKKGNYIYADIAFSYALYNNPHLFEWWVGAGTAREKSGDFRSALSAFTEALKLKPESEEAKRGKDRVRQKISP